MVQISVNMIWTKKKTIEASSAANESFLPRIFESLERWQLLKPHYKIIFPEHKLLSFVLIQHCKKWIPKKKPKKKKTKVKVLPSCSKPSSLLLQWSCSHQHLFIPTLHINLQVIGGKYVLHTTSKWVLCK